MYYNKLLTKFSIHFHGHCHGAPTGLSGRIMDIGLDCNNLYPFELNAVVERMKRIPKPTYDHHGDKNA